MPNIDPENTANLQTSTEYYKSELQNSRIILFELNKCILAITKSNVHSYTLNSGMSIQTVTRENLQEIINQRDALLYQISQLENMLGYRAAVIVMTPGW